MAENTKVTSEEVKEEKVETAKTSNTTKKKETKAPKKKKMRCSNMKHLKTGLKPQVSPRSGRPVDRKEPFLQRRSLKFLSISNL